jgi:signal transduction histidine kinase
MFKSLFLVAFILILFVSNAQQNSEPDSLLNLLKQKGISAESKIKVFRELSDYYNQNDPVKTLRYADSALIITNRSQEFINYLPGLLLMKGNAYKKQNMNGDALKFFNEGLQYAIQQKDKITEAKFYSQLAIIAEMTGEMVKALDLNQKALTIYMMHKDTSGMVTVYNDIGVIYNNKRDWEQAMAYYKKAVHLNDARKNLVANARLLNNIGLLLKEADQLDSALAYFNKALNNIDINKHKYGYALINNNLGITYREMKQFNRALDHFNTAKKLQLEMNDQYGLGLVNDNISRVYFAKGQYKESLAYLKEGLDYAIKADNLQLLDNISDHMANAYEQLGDYKNAYRLQKQAKIYDDSLQEKSLSNEIAELEVKYQVKQQQAENKLLKSENELQHSDIRNKNILIFGGIVFSILILTLLILAYRALRIKQKANAIIKEKNKKLELLYEEVEQQRKSIEEQKDEIARQNEELFNKNQYLSDLNHEKNSLMGIVAHDLKSPLNSIGGIMDMLPRLGPLNDGQKEFVGVTNKVIDSSRVLIQNLMDLSALENKELKVRLEPLSINKIMETCRLKYAGEALQKEIILEVVEQPADDFELLSDVHHIDRILQNLLSNALKFSYPGTTVKIGARRVSELVQFYVSDEGPGISEEDQKYLFKKFVRLSARPTKGESSSGLGLSIVKALVEELKGTIEVKSELKKGTTFVCSIPIK